MPSRCASVLIACVLSSAAGATLAQPAAPPAAPTGVAPVTVEAKQTPKMIQKETRQFVESFAKTTTALDQIARWHDPICVVVAGLPDDQNALIKARIEEVSKAVDHKVDRKGCHPNIEILFTDKPQEVMDVVAKRNEILLGYYHRFDYKKLKTVTHPIQAWYVTGTQGGGGHVASLMFAEGAGQVGGSPVMPGIQAHSDVIDDPDVSPPAACGDNPHFTACLRSNFKNVFVVADTKALAGKGVGLLSDYLVMLTLSQPSSLDGCNVLPSVIDLLVKDGCPGRETPDGLTPGDASYLTSLYKADLEANKQGEQGDIADRMARMLVKANGAPAK